MTDIQKKINREEVITVRFTTKEKKILDKMADKLGYSLSGYIHEVMVRHIEQKLEITKLK
jgi:uncharacterized protein (DUF1778 family)